MFNEIKHSFGLINAWQVSRHWHVRHDAYFPELQFARLLALWLGDKKELNFSLSLGVGSDP